MSKANDTACDTWARVMGLWELLEQAEAIEAEGLAKVKAAELGPKAAPPWRGFEAKMQFIDVVVRFEVTGPSGLMVEAMEEASLEDQLEADAIEAAIVAKLKAAMDAPAKVPWTDEPWFQPQRNETAKTPGESAPVTAPLESEE